MDDELSEHDAPDSQDEFARFAERIRDFESEIDHDRDPGSACLKYVLARLFKVFFSVHFELDSVSRFEGQRISALIDRQCDLVQGISAVADLLRR